MGSKFEAIKQYVLQTLQEYYDMVDAKGLPKKTFLRKLFGDKADTIYMRINTMRREGRDLTDWDMKLDTFEDLLNHIGYTLIPVIIPKDDTKKIDELEDLSVRSLQDLKERFEKILKEISNTNENRKTGIRKTRKVEADTEFLKRIQQKLSQLQPKDTEQKTANTPHQIDIEDDLFDT